MKNCHARNKSLQLNERVHDSSSGDDNNGVPSEENDHSRQPLLPINNNRKRYKAEMASVEKDRERSDATIPPQVKKPKENN
ncbi:hypothetical protein ACFX15_006174 [Malus domestica]